jgi:hypothetical protein
MTRRKSIPTLCGAAIALFALSVPHSSMGHDNPPGIDREFLNALERPDNDKNPSVAGSPETIILTCVVQTWTL